MFKTFYRYTAICTCPLNHRTKSTGIFAHKGKLNPIKFHFTPDPLQETKQHYIPNPSAILLPKNPYQTKKQLKPIIGITHLRPKDKIGRAHV